MAVVVSGAAILSLRLDISLPQYTAPSYFHAFFFLVHDMLAGRMAILKSYQMRKMSEAELTASGYYGDR